MKVDKSKWENTLIKDSIKTLKVKDAVQKKDYLLTGKYPIISQEKDFISGYCNTEDNLNKDLGSIVIFGDHTRTVKYVDFDFCVGADGVKVLQPNNSLSAKYLYYFIKWSNIPSNGYARHFKFLKEVKIKYPTDISIQQAIATELDALQEMIDGYKAQIADLDALAQSIFLDMFGNPVTNPKGWNLQTLKEVCSHIVDCPHSTPQKSAIPTEYPCIRTSELTDSGIEWNTMQYLNEEEYLKRTHRLKPQFGDLIYGREGTVGGCIMVPKEKHFSLGQRTMLFRPSKINSYLLLAIIRSPWIRNQAELKTVGQTVKHINIKDIIEFTIPVPPRTLQQHFATQVEAIELQKELLRQQLADAETLMAERMQYYFS